MLSSEPRLAITGLVNWAAIMKRKTSKDITGNGFFWKGCKNLRLTAHYHHRGHSVSMTTEVKTIWNPVSGMTLWEQGISYLMNW